VFALRITKYRESSIDKRMGMSFAYGDRHAEGVTLVAASIYVIDRKSRKNPGNAEWSRGAIASGERRLKTLLDLGALYVDNV
jgi:hypothetical protein